MNNESKRRKSWTYAHNSYQVGQRKVIDLCGIEHLEEDEIGINTFYYPFNIAYYM